MSSHRAGWLGVNSAVEVICTVSSAACRDMPPVLVIRRGEAGFDFTVAADERIGQKDSGEHGCSEDNYLLQYPRGFDSSEGLLRVITFKNRSTYSTFSCLKVH